MTALDETRRRQVELAEKLQAREPASVDRQRGLALAYKYQGRALVDLAFSQASIGSLRRDEGDLESALDSYRRAVQLGQQVYAADADNEFALERLASFHSTVGEVRSSQCDEALARLGGEASGSLRSGVEWGARPEFRGRVL